MRINAAPVTSCDVRWFFEGSLAQQDALRRWFQTPGPESFAREAQRTDVHLVIPGAPDFGIRWRDGTLQVEGRLGGDRTETFCRRFDGRLERWVTWSYDDLAAFYQSVFAAPPRGVVTLPVRKSRMLRAVRLDPRTDMAETVRPGTRVDRGLTVELIDLEVNGVSFSSLGFRAFPGDDRMQASFGREVSACLETLQHVRLTKSNSQSLAAWLATIAGCNARPVTVLSRRFGFAVAM
jgi:hypothetical protein